jgi:hypothetical protein
MSCAILEKKNFYLGTPNSFDLVFIQKNFNIENNLQPLNLRPIFKNKLCYIFSFLIIVLDWANLETLMSVWHF